ncbi:MAG: hypothetical protein J2P25_01815 [Nocardiopsaceae bacterium]|nr:hypothetical protein [Nocardiopsaceae bacterium]
MARKCAGSCPGASCARSARGASSTTTARTTLWIALPEPQRRIDPAFAHYGNLPVIEDGPARITVVAGEHAGQRSPAAVYSPLVGFEVTFRESGQVTLPAASGFEYGVLSADGPASVSCPATNAPVVIAPGQLRRRDHHRARGVADRRIRPGPRLSRRAAHRPAAPADRAQGPVARRERSDALLPRGVQGEPGRFHPCD